ncbi:MAG: MtrB/PioB family outer membrane beta-barrel protein [Syntrophales bacterium]
MGIRGSVSRKTLAHANQSRNWLINYWNTDIEEDVDTVGVCMTVQIIPNKLTLNVGYSFSLSKMDFDTVNPNGAVKLRDFYPC